MVNLSYCQKKENPVHVVVDDRERQSGVIEAFEQRTCNLEIRRLPLGDYLADEDLLVERKTVTDFAISIIDGRLFRQASRMASNELRTCFILEGDLGDLDRLDITSRSFQGAVITVNLVFDQPVLRSQSPEETAWLVLTAARQLARREVRRPPRYLPKTKGLKQIRSHMLQAVPGIGPDKAVSILDRLGDIRTVANAAAEDLVTVPGIGPKMAQRITWAFGED